MYVFLLTLILIILLIIRHNQKAKMSTPEEVEIRKKILLDRIGIDHVLSTDDINELLRIRSESKLKAEGKMLLTLEDIKILEEIGIHTDDLQEKD